MKSTNITVRDDVIINHVNFEREETSNSLIENICKAYKLTRKEDEKRITDIVHSCYSIKDARKLLVALLGKHVNNECYSYKLKRFYEAFQNNGFLTNIEDITESFEGFTPENIEKIMSGIKENGYHKNP
ncbi:hypothetical protein GOV08_03370 [Candidatus Woesearchaeota archaeon]|nr:hypothetical protein [Candidatus Woesearchaeota archaeon]